MLNIILALGPIAIILFVSEILWRKKKLKGEKARKFVHILAGIWFAFWPAYLPMDGIFVLGCLAFFLLVYSRYTKLFHAIYAVRRRTYGDLFYAVSIIICALLAREPWIFTVSVLLMSFADGMAAIVGRYWGEGNRYFVFGFKELQKSCVGTITYIVSCVAIITIGLAIGGDSAISQNILLAFIVLPIMCTVIENISPYGFDNLFVPIFSTILLNTLL